MTVKILIYLSHLGIVKRNHDVDDAETAEWVTVGAYAGAAIGGTGGAIIGGFLGGVACHFFGCSSGGGK